MLIFSDIVTRMYVLIYPVSDYLTLAESALMHLKQADEFWVRVIKKLNKVSVIYFSL
jgi:hypothetical protein